MSDQSQKDDLPTGLAVPARRALLGAGIQRIEQLAGRSETEIKQLHGIGPRALELLRRTLAEKGQSFGGEKERKGDAR